MSGATAGQINVILKMTDQLSGPMNQAAGTTEKATGGMMSSIGKLAALGGIAIAEKSLISFGASAVSAASDMNESLTKSQVLFGDYAKQIESFSNAAAASFGISKNEALAATGVFGNLFRAMEIGQGPAADMSAKLVGLAGDLASFNNADPSQVLEALRSGLVGETMPLRQFGINLNQVQIQQEALNLGLWNGKGTLDAAAKAQATYALILKQTSLAQGDFGRTSSGLANSQRILSATIADLKAKLGVSLLPAITQVTQILAKMVGALANASPAVQKMVVIFGLLVVGMMAAIPVMIGFGMAMDVMLGPVGLIVLAITGLIAIIVLLVANWDTITAKAPFLQTALDAVKESFAYLVEGIKAGITIIITEFKLWWDITSNVVKSVIAIFDGLGKVMEDVFTGKWGSIKNDAKKALSDIEGYGKDLASNFKDAANTVIDAVTEVAHAKDRTTDSFRQIGGAAEAMQAGVYSAGQGMMQSASDVALSWDAVQKSFDDNAKNASSAVSIWEGKLSDAKGALKILDDQKAAGQPLNDKQILQYQDLTWYVGRLGAGIKDDLNPAIVDAQDKNAQFMKAQDDLNKALADGTITQDEYNQSILDSAAAADPATAAAYGLTGAQKDLIQATADVVQQIKDLLVQLGLIPPDTKTTINMDSQDAMTKVDALNVALGRVPSDMTITAHLNAQAAINGLYALGDLVPRSPAKTGPFSKPSNWDWVFQGISTAIESQRTEAQKSMIQLGRDIMQNLATGMDETDALVASATSASTEIVNAMITGITNAKFDRVIETLSVDMLPALVAAQNKAAKALNLGKLSGVDGDQLQALQDTLNAATLMLTKWSADNNMTVQDYMTAAVNAAALADSHDMIVNGWKSTFQDIGSILDGTLIPNLERKLAGFQRDLSLAMSISAPAEVQQAIQDQINTVRLALMDAQTVLAKATAQGLVEPTVIALTDAGITAIRQAIESNTDGGASLVSGIVDAITAGRLSMEQAATLFTDPMIEKLRALEKEFTVNLAEAYINGTDPTGILANLKTVSDALDALNSTATDTAAALDVVYGTYVKGKGYYQAPGVYTTSNPVGGSSRLVSSGSSAGRVNSLGMTAQPYGYDAAGNPLYADPVTQSSGNPNNQHGGSSGSKGTLVNYGTLNITSPRVDSTTALLNDLGVH